MLSNAKLQQEFWAKEFNASCYLVNQSPSITIDCKIPKELWLGHSYDFSNLKIFGCNAYALVSKNMHSKLDPKSNKYSFVGYGDRVKGYRLWDHTTYEIIISRDVVFDEYSLTK